MLNSDQAALNLAIYNGPPANRPHMLPALANWICFLALPMWDEVHRKLVEPFLPHNQLGLIHLTSVWGAVSLPTIASEKITADLSYSGIRALAGTNVDEPSKVAQ